MPQIKIARPGGVVPRYAASLLKENMASEAENVKLWHGLWEPFRMPAPVFGAPQACVRSMHCFGNRWLTWDAPCVEVAQWLPGCPRVYVTGAAPWPQVAAQPQEGDAIVWKRVGLPVPTQAPEAQALDASRPERSTSSRSYFFVYVNSFGEEGAPSPVSNELLDMREGAVARIGIPVPPTEGEWDIAAIRLYRIAEGFNDGTKAGAPTATAALFVAELAPVAQMFDDGARTDELAEANVSQQYTPPPQNLENIVQLPDGVLAGSVGCELWFSEPWQPQAWPEDGRLLLDDRVVALKWQGGVLYALTDGHPYAISEECSDAQGCCRKAMRFRKAAPCVSRQSAVMAPDGVVYACPDGLMYLAGQRMSLLTGPWYARDDWQALQPHTMIGAMVEGQYMAVSRDAAFLFDIRDGVDNDGIEDNDLMPLSLRPGALHTARDGRLYLAFGNVIHEWDVGADFLPWRWRGKRTGAPGHANFAAAKVVLEGRPWPQVAARGVRFALRTDGRVALERQVKHSNPFRLPSGRRNLDFEVEMAGVERVREVHLASSVGELAG